MRTIRMRRLAQGMGLASFSMAVWMLTSTAAAANHQDKGKVIPNRVDGLYSKGGHFWYDDGSSHVYHGGKLGKAFSQAKMHGSVLFGALSPISFGHGDGLGLGHHGMGLDGYATHGLGLGHGGMVVDPGMGYGHGGMIHGGVGHGYGHGGVVVHDGHGKQCPAPVGTPIEYGHPGMDCGHPGRGYGHPGMMIGHPGMGFGHGLGMGHGFGHGGMGLGHGGLGLGLVHKLKAGLLGHGKDGAVFVGPGGPVPLTPGASNGYINPLKSPRDFLAYPPFATNVP